MAKSNVVNIEIPLSQVEESELDDALHYIVSVGGQPDDDKIVQYALILSRYGKQGRGVWYRWQKTLEKPFSAEDVDRLWREIGTSSGMSPSPGMDMSWIFADAKEYGYDRLSDLEEEIQKPGFRRQVITTRGDSFPIRAINWLWDGHLAKGKMHLLAGSPETGKTTLAMAMASIVTRGSIWPDGQPSEIGNVMIWSAEDSYEDTLAPRLMASGAQMSRVIFIESTSGDPREPSRAFDPAIDMAVLSETIESMFMKVKLLIIDPIVNAVSTDSHKNAEVRRGLQNIVDLAEKHSIAVLGITHFTKGTTGRDPVERVTGSLAFGALSRIVHITARGEGGRMMIRAKSNISKSGDGFLYDIEQRGVTDGIKATRAVFGDPCKGTPAELIEQVESTSDVKASKLDALDLVRAELVKGPIAPKDMIAIGKDMGFSSSTIRRAARSAGVVLDQQRRKWTLPGVEHTAAQRRQGR